MLFVKPSYSRRPQCIVDASTMEASATSIFVSHSLRAVLSLGFSHSTRNYICASHPDSELCSYVWHYVFHTKTTQGNTLPLASYGWL